MRRALMGMGGSSGGGGLVLVAGTSGALFTSHNTETWAAQSTGVSATIVASAWSPDLELFAIGTEAGSLLTSPDGASWTARTLPFASNAVRTITWSPDLGIFLAMGDGGMAATSPDGVNWTSQVTGTTEVWHGVAWSPDLGLFAAGGRRERISTSPDGSMWTQQQTGGSSSASNAMAWSPELGLFLSEGSRPIRSADGTTWQVGTGYSGLMYGMAWSPTLDLFVSVGDSSARSSSNGHNWSNFDIAGGTYHRSRDVTWSEALGLFVTASGTGMSYTSPDGITWTPQNVGSNLVHLHTVTAT